MGSYLGTVFALPDSLFAGAVPAAAAAAAALSEAALPAAEAGSAAARPPVATAEPAEPEPDDNDAAEAVTAAGRGGEDATTVQEDDARPLQEAGQPGITCRACEVGAQQRNQMHRRSYHESVSVHASLQHTLSPALSTGCVPTCFQAVVHFDLTGVALIASTGQQS